MWIIETTLALAATYSGGMWLYLCYVGWQSRGDRQLGDDIERYTFHLGLCFILAAGFLGLLLR